MIDSFKTWLNEPFNSSMSATRWVAFVCLLLAAMAFWHIVLRHLDAV